MRTLDPRLAVLAGFVLLLTAAPPARACSICRCGDPTFNALGTDVYKEGAFRVSLDWERFDKEQGIFGEEEPPAAKHGGEEEPAPGREAVIENRMTTALSYTFGERAIAVARLPWSSRSTSETGIGTTGTSKDLADPEIYGLVRLWSSQFTGGLGRRAWISALGGVKTAWGKNDLAQGGERLDEHLQPGTGSTDWFGGLSSVYLLDSHSSLFGSAQVRRTGANDFGYKYGGSTLLNLGYERKIGRIWDAAVELNFRNTNRDQIDAAGTLDPNTGGRLLYLTPRVILDLGKGLVGRLAIQVPVYKDLNGDQRERAVANVGVTYLF
ncbi:MAG TPA: hypothetical protein VIJ61_08605 [Thermoanaerobaculia bacterium]